MNSSENEYFLNFDEDFKEEEKSLKESLSILDEATKGLDSVISESGEILHKSYNLQKVFFLY